MEDIVTVNCEWPLDRCKIALVGEAPDEESALQDRPFGGYPSRVLSKMLRQAGIARDECLVTTAFNFVLPHSTVKSIGITKKEMEAEGNEVWPQLKIPVERGAYVPQAIGVPQLTRLHCELAEFRPNVVVALGGTAVWALLAIAPFGTMKKVVGSVHKGCCRPFKVIPTYNPGYVINNYSEMARVIANLKKAKRESAFPEIRRPKIDIIIPKTAEEVEDFLATIGTPAAVDIETLTGTIDNIGFADCFERAMSVPIYDPSNYRGYWDTPEECARVVWAIAQYLMDPTKIKVMQNGSYDTTWLWERWKVPTQGWTEDTRVLHHALWPESPKDLGTIASLHLDMPSWKLSGGGRRSTKREE